MTSIFSPNRSSKRSGTRRSLWALVAVLLFCAVTVGVSAIEPCQRAVKRVITEVHWPHYSKATVARWNAWGKAHPNYVAPKRRPVVSKRETQDMLEFACDSPALENPGPPTAMLEEPPDSALGMDMSDPRPYLIAMDSGTPTVALLNVPVRDQAPVLPGATPEPGSIILSLTGAIAVLFLARRRMSGSVVLGSSIA